MPRRTLGDAKASRIPEAVNLPPDDYRFTQYVNEAQEQLLQRGHWWGTMARFLIQSTAGLITMPRQIATIERASLNQEVTPVRDFWYEWLDNGWGPLDETKSQGFPGTFYRGHYPVFSDIVGQNKALVFYCDLAVDAGKYALAQGWDDATPPNWIRNQIGSSSLFESGERIKLGQMSDPVKNLSSAFFGRVTDIQLPDDMQGQCWLYEYDTIANTQRLIGQYDAGESRPTFARYLFPSINIGTTNPVNVEVLAKLAFVKAINDSDYLVIGNLKALKLACMAVKAEEELRLSDASILINGGVNSKTGQRIIGAIGELDAELDHYLGAGRRMGINLIGTATGSAEPIDNLL